MKIKILFALAWFPFIVLGQTNTKTPTVEEVNNLKQTIQSTRSLTNEIDVRVENLEGRLKNVSKSLDEQLSVNQQLQEQLQNNLQTQAQNERAVNLALDEFSKKFEEQNRTVEGVKASLDEQLKQQLVYYTLALAVFVIVLIIAVKISTAKALKQQQKSWNEFNEYIIKSKKQ
jgi:preprotein translocase subunit SecF